MLRFITDAARKEGPFITNNTTNTTDLKRKLAIKHHSYSMSSSNRSNTPTGLYSFAMQFQPYLLTAWHWYTIWNNNIFFFSFSVCIYGWIGCVRSCLNWKTGSEIDDEEMIVSESENSNDSWTTEEFSSEFIMRYGSRLIINYHKNAIALSYLFTLL